MKGFKTQEQMVANTLGLIGDEGFPCGGDQRLGGGGDAVRRGQCIQLLQRRVHHRAAQLRGGRRFGEPVDGAEPVQQRTLLEVAGSRRQQRGPPPLDRLRRDLVLVDARSAFGFSLAVHVLQLMAVLRQPRARASARLLAG